MEQKNLTVTIRHQVRTEVRCRNWPGRLWQRFRKALGILLIQDEIYRSGESSLTVFSQLYQGFYNIAKDNKFRKEDIEITTTRQETASNETTDTLTLLHQKRQVCQAVLRTTWSRDGAVTQVTAPACLLSPILSSGNLFFVVP